MQKLAGWIVVIIVVGLCAWLVIWTAMRPTPPKTVFSTSPVRTVIEYIDLPEEFDAMSSDPKYPSPAYMYRSQDTAFIYYNNTGK